MFHVVINGGEIVKCNLAKNKKTRNIHMKLFTLIIKVSFVRNSNQHNERWMKDFGLQSVSYNYNCMSFTMKIKENKSFHKSIVTKQLKKYSEKRTENGRGEEKLKAFSTSMTSRRIHFKFMKLLQHKKTNFSLLIFLFLLTYFATSNDSNDFLDAVQKVMKMLNQKRSLIFLPSRDDFKCLMKVFSAFGQRRTRRTSTANLIISVPKVSCIIK